MVKERTDNNDDSTITIVNNSMDDYTTCHSTYATTEPFLLFRKKLIYKLYTNQADLSPRSALSFSREEVALI